MERLMGLILALGQAMAADAASCVSVCVLASSWPGSDEIGVKLQGGLASGFSALYLAATGYRH
ncbi:MAG: hypothetical protein MKZ85_11780 [Pedosphaera sp.]|nr:hypothetical protein [Pedosphaera sp.]